MVGKFLAATLTLMLCTVPVLSDPTVELTINAVSGDQLAYNYKVTNNDSGKLSELMFFTPLLTSQIMNMLPSDGTWSGEFAGAGSDSTVLHWYAVDWEDGLQKDQSQIFTLYVPNTAVKVSGYKFPPNNSNWGWGIDGNEFLEMSQSSIDVPAPAGYVVPEPSSLASAAGLGILALTAFTRRRKG